MYYPTEEDLFFVQMEKWMKNNPLEKPTDTWHKVVAWNKGKKLTESHKQALSDAHKKLPKSGNARSGIVFTEEHKRKLSEASKNRKMPMSEEQKEKYRKLFSGKPKLWKKIMCPHCNLESTEGTMKRWHLDNCKYKLNLPK